MRIKSIIAGLVITLPCLAADLMVERMQDVVSEVRELRQRYEDSVHKHEACVSKLKEQEGLPEQKALSSASDKIKIEELSSENLKLNEALQAAKIQNTKYKKLLEDFKSLKKEKERLSTSATILVEKNHALLGQVNAFKRSSSEKKETKSIELLEEKERLLRELEICKKRPKRSAKKVKVSKDICIDDNPFPVLLKKETAKKPEIKRTPEEIKAPEPKQRSSAVYRIKGESAIYNALDGDVIDVWEDKRSFTSNISQDNWIRITGYFINRKWTKANTQMWVEREHTIKR